MDVRLPALSIFHRLLLAIVGIALAGAITSGYIHYKFAAKLIQASVTTHMDTALDSAVSRLRTTYTVPGTLELQTLRSAAAVRSFLEAFEGERLVRRAAVERLFANRIRSVGANQRSLRLVGVDGNEQVVVAGGKRRRQHFQLLESIAPDPLKLHLTELFTTLRNAESETPLVHGPFERSGGGYSIFMGIALTQPDIGGFGGALVSEWDLSEFLAYVADLRILGNRVGWVFDQTGRSLSSPAASDHTLDPHPFLFDGAPIPDASMIRATEFGPLASALHPRGDINEVLRIALSLPPSVYSQQFAQGKQLAVFILVGVALFAFVVALGVSRPIGAAIGTLLRMTEAVTRGELDARAPTTWRGEFGGLALGFNRMLERLQDSLIEARNQASRAERAQRQTEQQSWIKDGLHRLSEATRGESEIAALCQRALAALGEHLGLVAARFYHVEGAELVSVAGYALSEKDDRSRLRLGEGLPGQVAQDRHARCLNGVADSRLAVSSALLAGSPDTVYLVPVLLNDSVKGVLELGLAREPSAELREFIEAACGALAVNLHSLEQQRKTELALVDVRAKTKALEAANGAAEAASRAKSEFLANMSHEIRTPINGVLGMNEVLLKSSLSDKQRRCALAVRRSAESLLRVINDILDFSKIEAGKLDLDAAPFDLRELMEDIAELFADAAQRKGLELVCALPASMHRAYTGDSGRLRQILVNLLGNAIKFTETGEVTVHVSEAAREADSRTALLRFDVHDTGIGIPAKLQTGIFESFVQADGSTSRHYGGTGLGLAISAQLAQLMGGEVGLSSEQGVGSQFWFTVELERETHSGADADDREALAHVHVLAVDDNETNRAILTEQLAYWSAEHECVASGKEALARLRDAAFAARPFDLAIIDMHMPGMDGLTLAREIEADPALHTTRRVLLSSIADQVPASEIGTGAIHASLSKPARHNDLLRCLAGVMGTAAPATPGETQTAALQHFAGRVLLVEDNPVNQEVVLEYLEPTGLHIDVEEDGKAAVRAFTAEQYDLVLMDCQLPVLDGFEAARAIRASEHASRVPIVALTANALQGDRERCLEAGMDEYLSKPFSEEDLFAILERWLPDDLAGLESAPAAVASEDDPVDMAVLDGFRARERNGKRVLARLIDAYLACSESHVAQLRDAVVQGDASAARFAAHSLKSSSANVGAKRLAEMCGRIEREARERADVGCLSSVVVELQALHDAVCETLAHERPTESDVLEAS